MEPRYCRQCDSLFRSRSRIHRFCTRKCCSDYYRAKANAKKANPVKHCVECKKEFTIGVSDTICSNECLAAHRGLDKPHDPWQRGIIKPTRYAENLHYTPSFEAGF
jgi:hypothetical protein